MKKFKLFALAAFAMLSTNVFAQSATDVADDTWQYTTKMDGDGEYTLATLTGLVDSKKGTVENLEIPAQVTGTGGFKYTVDAIDANAFKDDAKIKTVTFTTAIESIGIDAFNNCYNLTTVTFPAESKLATIGNGAFAETAALEKIDLSNTAVTDLSGSTPFVDGTNLNVSLEEIVLNESTTAIGTALKGLAALKKTNIASTRIQTIVANAFDGDKKLTSLELPAIYLYDPLTGKKLDTPLPTTLENDALAGSFIQTLTINGSVGDGGIGKLGASTLTTVNFKGVVGEGTNAAIVTDAFKGNYGLATVTFGEVKAGAIGTGSFTDAATDKTSGDPKGTLAFTIGKAEAVVFEDVKVFAAAALADVTKNNVNITAPNAAVGTLVLNRANFKPATDPEVAEQVKVYGESTFYGKYINRSTTASVAINRAKAIVYSAYTDGSKVYMDPLQSVKGQQIIGPGQAVIVKAVGTPKEDTEKGYKYIELEALATGAPGHTIRVNAANKIVNDIDFLVSPDIDPTDANSYISAATLKAKQADKVLYVVGDLSNGLTWQTPKDAVRLYRSTVYIFADAATASGRLEVIWLDGSEEEATAIKSVKTAAEKGAIYNLAGQKVNAAYKGVVIKDGKKYIQK